MKYETFRQAVIDRIKELAYDQKLSINQLCKISHVSSSAINKFFNDPRTSVTINTIEKLCYGLKISVSDFFNDPRF